MIKKFISNTLLSMVMDKSARTKLAKIRDKDAPTDDVNASDMSTSDADIIATISDALAEARTAAQSPPQKQQKINSKAVNFKSKKSTTPSPKPQNALPAKKQASPERQKLIQDAIAIHRKNAHVLDELNPEIRDKLQVMAMYALDPESLPASIREQAGKDALAEGIVDEIGGASKRRRPKKT